MSLCWEKGGLAEVIRPGFCDGGYPLGNRPHLASQASLAEGVLTWSHRGEKKSQDRERLEMLTLKTAVGQPQAKECQQPRETVLDTTVQMVPPLDLPERERP